MRKRNEAASGGVQTGHQEIFFAEKVVRHWKKLSRVMALSLWEAKGF